MICLRTHGHNMLYIWAQYIRLYIYGHNMLYMQIIFYSIIYAYISIMCIVCIIYIAFIIFIIYLYLICQFIMISWESYSSEVWITKKVIFCNILFLDFPKEVEYNVVRRDFSLTADNRNFDVFMSYFSLKSLIKGLTCFQSNPSALRLILELIGKNKNNSFKNTHVTEVKISNHCNIILAVLKKQVTKEVRK